MAAFALEAFRQGPHLPLSALADVGSWAAGKALARSGIGTLTLIDLIVDDICVSNTQPPTARASSGQYGKTKTRCHGRSVLRAINPAADIRTQVCD